MVALENGNLATMATFGVAPLTAIADLVVEADAPKERLERSGLRLHCAARASGAGAQACGLRKAGTLAEVRS